MPQDDRAAPEIKPLPEFIRTLSEGLRANAELDQDLVSILETHLINAEPNNKSGAATADAIEKLAVKRAGLDDA